MENTPATIHISDLSKMDCADNDNIRLKAWVRDILIHNQDILLALHNTDFEQNVDDDGMIDGEQYWMSNIKPYYILTDTITDKKNFICYDSDFEEPPSFGQNRKRNILKKGLLRFYILCDADDIEYERAARHDVIAYLIERLFNWTHYDTRLQLISDRSGTVDNGYVSRTLVFEYEKLNGITETNRIDPDSPVLETHVVNNTKGL